MGETKSKPMADKHTLGPTLKGLKKINLGAFGTSPDFNVTQALNRFFTNFVASVGSPKLLRSFVST